MKRKETEGNYLDWILAWTRSSLYLRPEPLLASSISIYVCTSQKCYIEPFWSPSSATSCFFGTYPLMRCGWPFVGWCCIRTDSLFFLQEDVKWLVIFCSVLDERWWCLWSVDIDHQHHHHYYHHLDHHAAMLEGKGTEEIVALLLLFKIYICEEIKIIKL